MPRPPWHFDRQRSISKVQSRARLAGGPSRKTASSTAPRRVSGHPGGCRSGRCLKVLQLARVDIEFEARLPASARHGRHGRDGQACGPSIQPPARRPLSLVARIAASSPSINARYCTNSTSESVGSSPQDCGERRHFWNRRSASARQARAREVRSSSTTRARAAASSDGAAAFTFCTICALRLEARSS
jgi:hypothetical protein